MFVCLLQSTDVGYSCIRCDMRGNIFHQRSVEMRRIQSAQVALYKPHATQVVCSGGILFHFFLVNPSGRRRAARAFPPVSSPAGVASQPPRRGAV